MEGGTAMLLDVGSIVVRPLKIGASLNRLSFSGRENTVIFYCYVRFAVA